MGTYKDAPASVVRTHQADPEHGPKEIALDSRTIQRNALTDEARRTILREATTRYRNEMMDHDERMELLDRIKRLRRELALDIKTGLTS